MKSLLLILLSLLFLCDLEARTEFKFVRVDAVETLNETITCATHELSSGYYLYVAGAGNEIEVFTVSGDGKLSFKASFVVSNGIPAVRGLTIAEVGQKIFLFAGLKGGNAVEVFEILPEGALKSVFVMPDSESTFLGKVIALKVVRTKSESILFAGGLESPAGLSSFRIETDGSLVHIQSVADTDDFFTDGIIDMSASVIGGKTFLFTGGFQDNGLSSWRVYENGRFENLSNIGDDECSYLNGTYPVLAVSLGDWNYLVVGHRHHSYYEPGAWLKDRFSYYYHGDALSVFLVDSKGVLRPRSVFMDDGATLLRGQTRLLRLPFADENLALIAAGTSDDCSIQLCVMDKSGRLYGVGNTKSGFPIYYGMCSLEIGDDLFLFAGSEKGKELVSYSVRAR